jgi:hypothetical protein
MSVILVDAIVRYLRLSGWTPQSVAAVRDDQPRWVRRLERLGIVAIPSLVSRACSSADAGAHLQLNVLMTGASRFSRGSPIAHQLRNLAGVRPPKL